MLRMPKHPETMNQTPTWARVLIGAVIGGLVAFAIAAAVNHSRADCIILANGGRKLCGSDAAAWCDSTDGLRQLAGDQASQDACDKVRGRATVTDTQLAPTITDGGSTTLDSTPADTSGFEDADHDGVPAVDDPDDTDPSVK
jgi:hypothetical protein